MQRRHLASNRAKRLAAGAASLACFAAALALMPAGARSHDAAPPLDFAAGPPAVARAPIAVAPQRDAFAPRAELDEERPPVLPSPPPAAGLRAVRAPALAAPQTSAVRVMAIANGAQPIAIVEEGGVQRVVAIGDRLNGSTIVAIEDDALVLAGGVRVALETASGPR
jgi:hypothetical protein